VRRCGLGESRLVEDLPEPGLPPPSLACWPRPWRRREETALSTPSKETTSSLRTTSSRWARRSPPPPSRQRREPGLCTTESLPDDVRTERPKVLGPGIDSKRESPRPLPVVAPLTSALDGSGDHSGWPRWRHLVDGHPRRRLPAQLPGECGDRALGAAVRAGSAARHPSPR